ncbi:MAG: hypothetical protein C5B53_03650 [Candidatus Melainabacteria bacterium]|nr:MAG: hypothetical protein C5B53_03650 [Candidatus Melainabacteria bacterium]
MQPFDALTMRAVLAESQPLIINRKVDGVCQFGRDELILSFRAKSGASQFRLSAHPIYGRLSMVRTSTDRKTSGNEMRTSFATILKKALYGATLVGIEQLPGERIVDLIFSCLDEVGRATLKTLSAEIMGRHSNLIFWERSDQKIIAASHLVNSEMSRFRQIQPGLKYARPPGQERPSIFTLKKEEFSQRWSAFELTALDPPASLEDSLEKWLASNYSGLGKNLAGEIIEAVRKDAVGQSRQLMEERLWSCLERIQGDSQFKPAMRSDLSRYTVLDLADEAKASDQWLILPAVNDLVEQFYSAKEAGEVFRQTKERMLKEAQTEIEKLKTRWQAISQGRENGASLEKSKLCGDLILANLHTISSGQLELVCQNIFSEALEEIVIPLNNNLTASQNAQNYYRQFAKVRNRQRTAELAWQDTESRIEKAQEKLKAIETTSDIAGLRALNRGQSGPIPAKIKESPASQKRKKSRLLNVTSSDGWAIYVGRNRQENDLLLSKLSQPRDLWLHVLGHSGSHVLIKTPGSKNEPPQTTIREAAQLAARFSKVTGGAKVRVVYTEVRFVKRAANGKSGMVNYENEKTIEVDTAHPLPKIFKQLFSGRD